MGKNNKQLTTEEFIRRASLLHGIYDYSKCHYINAHTKTEIICPKHGSFWQAPLNHFKRKGCPKCSNNARSNLNDFVEKSHRIHGELWDYSESQYVNDLTKLKINCLKHGGFYQTPRAHLNGEGCPKCRLSKGEKSILNFLHKNNIDYIHQKSFDQCRNPKTGYKLFFDFYLPSYNCLIEFDGIQHENMDTFNGWKRFPNDLKETQYRDSVKTNFANFNRIELIRISFKNIRRIDSILKERLKIK